MDIGLSSIGQCEPSYCDEAGKSITLANHLSYDEQFKSKYLIVIDGNTWP